MYVRMNKINNTNLTTQDGWTPLMVASSKNFPEVVQELLSSGANPNIFNKVNYSTYYHCLLCVC